MSGKENKNIPICTTLCSSRKSIASPFSNSSRKAASSGVRLPSLVRRTITVPLIPNNIPLRSCIPYLRRSVKNPRNTEVLRGQNIPKINKCNIKPEVVNTRRISVVRSLNKKSDNSLKLINQPKSETCIIKQNVLKEPLLKPSVEKEKLVSNIQEVKMNYLTINNRSCVPTESVKHIEERLTFTQKFSEKTSKTKEKTKGFDKKVNDWNLKN